MGFRVMMAGLGLVALTACAPVSEGPRSFTAGGVVFTGVEEPGDRNHGRNRYNDREDGVELD